MYSTSGLQIKALNFGITTLVPRFFKTLIAHTTKEMNTLISLDLMDMNLDLLIILLGMIS